jgi:hypothetical protein
VGAANSPIETSSARHLTCNDHRPCPWGKVEGGRPALSASMLPANCRNQPDVSEGGTARPIECVACLATDSRLRSTVGTGGGRDLIWGPGGRVGPVGPVVPGRQAGRSRLHMRPPPVLGGFRLTGPKKARITGLIPPSSRSGPDGRRKAGGPRATSASKLNDDARNEPVQCALHDDVVYGPPGTAAFAGH